MTESRKRKKHILIHRPTPAADPGLVKKWVSRSTNTFKSNQKKRLCLAADPGPAKKKTKPNPPTTPPTNDQPKPPTEPTNPNQQPNTKKEDIFDFYVHKRCAYAGGIQYAHELFCKRSQNGGYRPNALSLLFVPLALPLSSPSQHGSFSG